MKKEFVVERQGRSFVLYAGLLDEAHSQGLKSINTSLLQVPNESNGNVAICHATVETDRGRFTGIGDASPSNVASGMLSCIIRMSETRAKARALRDAVNVGVAALEELGDPDDGAGTALPGHATAAFDARRPRVNGQPPAGNGSAVVGLATPAQVRAIYLIGRDQHALDEAQVQEKIVALYGCTPPELSKKQASELITKLKNGVPR